MIAIRGFLSFVEAFFKNGSYWWTVWVAGMILLYLLLVARHQDRSRFYKIVTAIIVGLVTYGSWFLGTLLVTYETANPAVVFGGSIVFLTAPLLIVVLFGLF